MDMDFSATFTVYKHTSPKGKIYIGITSQKPEIRWGFQGSGYKENKHFWSAIQLYGWENFKHEILASNLAFTEACNLEVYYISYYNSMDPEFGYNQTTGGNFSQPSEAVRMKLSESTKNLWKTAEFRNKVCSSLRGHKVSQTTRDKISKANLGRNWGPHPCKGIYKSEEIRKKYRGRSPWNKGLTKETSSIIFEYSQKLQGLKRTDIQKENIRIAQKDKYKNGYKPIWITNNQVELQISCNSEGGYEIPEGFHRGRLNRNQIYMYKDDISIKVDKSKEAEYIQLGWIPGRGHTISTTMKKVKQKFIWVLDDIMMFNSAEDLAHYLNLHGYPKIVGSTVSSLYRKGFETSKIYRSLNNRISRIDVIHENKQN